MARDIRAGKKANQVEYGRQDVDYEQISKGRKSQRVHGERFALLEEADKINEQTNMSQEERRAGVEVADFITSVAKMVDRSKISKRKHRIDSLSPTNARIIEKLMKEIDKDFSAEGYDLWIDGTGADHIEVRHGTNGEANQSMASRSAKEMIPWAANHADSGEIMRDKNGDFDFSTRFRNFDESPAVQIRLIKKISGDTFYVSECVPDSANKIVYITSAYIKKGSDDHVLNLDSFESQQPTPEAVDGDYTTTKRIAQTKPKVNRNDKISLKDRLALPEDGEKKKKYHMSPGQLRADVANKIHKKAYSKADARAVLGDLTGVELLNGKTQESLASYLWQGFNTCETKEQREHFAKRFSEELGKRLYLMVEESPDAQMYRERLENLKGGIGRLTISSGEYSSEFMHRLDR